MAINPFNWLNQKQDVVSAPRGAVHYGGPVLFWYIKFAVLRGVDQDIVGAQHNDGGLAGGNLDEMHARAARYDNKAEYLCTFLQIMTAATASFVHGTNDVSKSGETGGCQWAKKRKCRSGFLSLAVPVIAIGLWTYGYRIMRNLGNKVTLHRPSRGFSMDLASAFTIIFATRLSLPVSTTQCITAQIIHRAPGMLSPHMSTFSSGKRPREKRSSATKVRSGCITCKRRHVKCDETRPFCLRCTESPRSPRVCEGYLNHASGRERLTNRPAPRPILPKGTTTWRASWPAGGLLVEPGYEAAFLADPKERVYFDFWQQLIGNIYLFPSDAMHRVIPQLARREPAIKHAALAMAAMARALVPSLLRRSGPELHASGPHYEFALRQYGRAVGLVRSAQPSRDNMLCVIVCCVLFVTFECLHGDRAAALSHVGHAYRMMEIYFGQPRSSADEDGPPAAATQSIRAVCDDAAWVFQGLTMQAWSHNVLHSELLSEVSWCCRGVEKALAVDEMPPRFADMDAARRWWRIVQHYTCHRCPIHTEVFVDGLSTRMLAGSRVRPVLSPTQGGEKLAAAVPVFLDRLRRWSTAFQAVYDDLRSRQHLGESDYHSYVDACNLRLQYLTLWNEVSSLSYTDIRMVIVLTPSFREMVQLSRTILRAQSGCGGCGETFSMDNGPTWPLMVTACRCRDAGLRREATELLGKHNRRDGLWDSRTFYGLAVRNLEIEDEQWSRMARRELRFSREGDVSGRLLRWDPCAGEWLQVEELLMDAF
ncbi:Phosphate-repressible phosphate permease pho-4 [Colletotrichum shisoi]|uniref:Phosphate-repressible phosphate permease pho-4 n=1 Tax=Colletotrichum shisoi TaxID=2078593 RepID=A0A5Q4BCY7_9PEZI|nr:Phosphate-repressible phosphate permease pho-4 [Colletotrichum shisoi]